MREIADIVRCCQRNPAGRFALATLVRARGSSYRRPGARMLIAEGGDTAGSLSGGCLEEEVAERAREVIRTGFPTLMSFDTRRRFGCHGVIEIFLELAGACLLRALSDAFHQRKTCCVSTVFEGDENRQGSRFVEAGNACPHGAFVQALTPEIQLVIVGDGPDTTALRSFAATLGWRVSCVASASELTGPFDEWTAALVETHNYGRDFAALRTLARHDLRYIGLVGPRRRRDQLLADLMDTGVRPGANLFAPAGLDLGADSPEQIALAIVAEIQGVFAGGSLEALRERSAPIHAPAPARSLPAVSLGA